MNILNTKICLGAKVLQQLVSSENSCVEVVQRERDLRTLPYHGNNFASATKEQLNGLIGKFVKELNGVVLGYKNIKILSNLALIDDDGLNNFSIRADFFVFKPIPGKELPAMVTKKSNDHVGCLVYNTFNMSIPKPVGVVNWTGNNVEIGQEITARVTFVKLESRIPYITGEFLEKSSVNKKIIFSDSEEAIEDKDEEILNEEGSILVDSDTEKTSKKKKRSRRSLENGIDPMIYDGKGETKNDSDTEKTSKKKKRSRRSLENGIDPLIYDEENLDEKGGIKNDSDNENTSKKKKKSYRNSENVIDEQDSPNEVSKESFCDIDYDSVRNKKKKSQKSIENENESIGSDLKSKKRRKSISVEDEGITKKRKVA